MFSELEHARTKLNHPKNTKTIGWPDEGASGRRVNLNKSSKIEAIWNEVRP